MSAVLKEFEEYLTREKMASKNTYLSYLRDLGQFEQFLISCNTDLLRATSDDVEAYVDKLDFDGKSPATAMRTIAALKCFYNHLVLKDTLEESPVRVQRTVRREVRCTEILTSSAEVNLLLSQPKTVDAKGFRDKAMLETLYATGMRVTELVSMNVEDLNLELGFVRCVGKNRERIIPLYPTAVDALRTYLRRPRRILVVDASERSLFVNISGERMTRQGFWKLIKYYAAQAGIGKDITPYTLRHSFAVHLLENGADLHVLQELMGHADASSTQVYASLITGKLGTVYNRAHPNA